MDLEIIKPSTSTNHRESWPRHRRVLVQIRPCASQNFHPGTTFGPRCRFCAKLFNETHHWVVRTAGPWKAACSCWATVQKMQVPWPLHSRWDQKLQPRWNQIYQPDLRSLFRLLCWPPWRWSCRWTSQGSNKILKWRKETHSISSCFPIYSNLKVTFKMTNDCTQPFIKTWINFTSEHILVLFGGWVLVIGAGAGSIVSVLSAVGHH